MARPAYRSALILEPSLVTRQALKRLLRRYGFERVQEADSVAAALMLLREQPVDLVLTPWAAPGMTGTPLFRALREGGPNGPGRGSPPAVILLDEGLSQQHVVAAVKEGVAGRLPIPAQAGTLSRILGTIAEPARAAPASRARKFAATAGERAGSADA